MTAALLPTLFDHTLTELTEPGDIINNEDAEMLFLFFKNHPLFNWKDQHNGCEARADAICVLLEEWSIPHYKAWVFSGLFLKDHVGGLRKNWNYHVAPLLPVKYNGEMVYMVLDPATGDELQPLYNWAAGITDYPHSYHFIRLPHWYIFNQKKITTDNWHRRNRQNRKWMVQGLAGINALNAIGKARLCFNKRRVKNTAVALEELKKQFPL